ncbi:Transposase protein [Cinara cedri]|uniref:Transposase protein n=1 Tax=Cinara cedri TaxID=506608 RepID=A0A5E4MAN5_9HEMI|nr:Transposase protein [Cinara cedri]
MLTFKQHQNSTKHKIKPRKNIIAKLAGSSWSCNANTLRTSALSLVFSVAEYCAPGQSKALQPNGYLFFHIFTPQKLGDKELPKVPSIKLKGTMTCQFITIHHPTKHLKSRHSIWKEAKTEFDPQVEWKRTWLESDPEDHLKSHQNQTRNMKLPTTQMGNGRILFMWIWTSANCQAHTQQLDHVNFEDNRNTPTYSKSVTNYDDSNSLEKGVLLTDKDTLMTTPSSMCPFLYYKYGSQKITPELRTFAVTLHFYSSAAYNYERNLFNKTLPHSSTMRKWYTTVDGTPGFTEKSLKAVELKVNEMKKK